jgi:hypothetical protein
MLTKQAVIDYMVANPLKYFSLGKCPICHVGDYVLYASRSGQMKRGSSCKCMDGQYYANCDITISDPNADPYVPDLLDFYIDPAQGYTADLEDFITS